MVRIAICDDEPNAVAAHREAAEDCLRRCGCAGEIQTYTDGANLLADIADDGFCFDLILLDIEMPGDSGMELARSIQPHLPQCRIIFVTSHIEYAIDAFELSIFRYVPKAELERRLPAAITDALKLILLEDGRAYTIKTHSRLEKIPYRDILFIARDGKNASITTPRGTSRVRKSLWQVAEELDAEEFIFIDRGCIVNVIHIAQVRGGMVVLQDGTALPVSRSHLQGVKEQINAYWGAHL